MNKTIRADIEQQIREVKIATRESAFMRSRRTLHRYSADDINIATSPRITNESNLISGENVTVSGDGSCGHRARNCSGPSSRRGDDDDGDGEPEPDRVRKQRICTHPDFNELPKDGFLRLWQVLRLIPIGKSSWWAGCRSGKYPQGIKLGPRTTVWRIKDVLELISAQEGRQ